MDLRRCLQAIRKFWWVILIPGLLGAAYGAFSVSREVPLYRASVTFFVTTTGDAANLSAVAQGDQFAQRRVNSYVGLLSTERLANMVLEKSGLDGTPGKIIAMIDASGDINTVLLTATATSTSEEEAEAVATAIATEFPKVVDQVENEGTTSTAVSLELVSGPTVKQVPTQPTFTVGLNTAIGLALGLVLALLLELRDNAVRSDQELEELGVGPVLGRIAMDRTTRDAPLVTAAASQSVRAESFRQLRTNLRFIDAESPVRTLVVTSSVAGEGKSVTSANLALTMSAADRRVLLIEADLRQPKLADYLGVERAVGLTDVLVGHVRPEDVLQPWGDNGLEVLPSGHLPPNPSELLGSDNMGRLMAELREQFDLIVLDTPPLLPVTDAAVAATQADGVLLIARWGKTTRQQIETSLQALQAVNARVLGSVLTMVPSGRSSFHYGTYGTRHVESVNEAPVAEPTGPSPFVEEVARGLTPRGTARRTELQTPAEPVRRTPQGRR